MRHLIAIVLLLASVPHAHAIVGGASPATDDDARAVVTIVGSRGGFCSGALIAPTIVLTAAHCVQRGGTYKVISPGVRGPLIDVTRIAMHPRFSAQDMTKRRAGADVALLQIASPSSATPLATAAPTQPIDTGRTFRIIGSGISTLGGEPGGSTRSASLAVTGRPGALQIRLVDPATANRRAGLGACDGDSGGPAFEDQTGRGVIVGVIAWSTGPNNSAGCGGLTGVTPLTLYRDWIVTTMKAWSGGRD